MNVIRKGKDKLIDSKQTHIVYQINCSNCDAIYIGQTKRYLEIRVKEHQHNIRESVDIIYYSVVTNHCLSNEHEFNWSRPMILQGQTERGKLQKCFLSKNLTKL